MLTAPAARLPAVLETSFWTVAYRAEIAANCLDFFEIIVPRGVEDEILTRHPEGLREYPQATLFRHLRGFMKDPPEGPLERLPMLGRGEAEAIPLAQRLQLPLLINDWRAARYARGLQIPVITPASIIVLLYQRGIISRRAARRKVQSIEPFTVREFLDDARAGLR